MSQPPEDFSRLSYLLSKISSEVETPPSTEATTEQESMRFELSGDEAHAKLEIEEKHLHNQSLSQDISERKKYATMIFVLVCVWLLLVLLIVVCTRVSDSVLIALITGVSVNVIALFAIVAKYLFPKR